MHDIEPKEYYDKYIKENQTDGICPYCGGETKFIKISKGYNTYCCKEHFYQSELVKEHRKNTNLMKFGVENCFQSNICQAKIKETLLKRYGVENPLKSDIIKEKLKNTNIEKYGCENVFQAEVVKEKSKTTMLSHYGVEHNTQSSIIRNKSKTRYIYENLRFDSSSEIAFYIWCKDHGFNIIRTDDYFEYYSEGKLHKYFPDFKIDDKYYEIKGNNLITEDCLQLLDPITHKTNQLLIDKLKCIKLNNVIIIKSKDLYKCEQYISNKYGKTYIKQFKNI